MILFNDNISKNIVGNPNEQASSIKFTEKESDVELEHGLINKNTNVTDNDLIKTMKIALAHLNEFSNYYNKDYGILKFEEYLKTKKQTNK